MRALHQLWKLVREQREVLILALLREHGELSGLDLQRLSGGRLGARVYGDLDHLEAEGLIVSRRVPRTGEFAARYPWRRVYRLSRGGFRLRSLVYCPDRGLA
jgi:DNA-binding PadR family transcriptional regulator